MPVHHRLPRPKSTCYGYPFIHVPAALFCLMLAASSARGEHLGSPDLEPGLIGRGDIVFFEDFEYADDRCDLLGNGCLSTAEHIVVKDRMQRRTPVKP